MSVNGILKSQNDHVRHESKFNSFMLTNLVDSMKKTIRSILLPEIVGIVVDTYKVNDQTREQAHMSLVLAGAAIRISNTVYKNRDNKLSEYGRQTLDYTNMIIDLADKSRDKHFKSASIKTIATERFDDIITHMRDFELNRTSKKPGQHGLITELLYLGAIHHVRVFARQDANMYRIMGAGDVFALYHDLTIQQQEKWARETAELLEFSVHKYGFFNAMTNHNVLFDTPGTKWRVDKSEGLRTVVADLGVIADLQTPVVIKGAESS